MPNLNRVGVALGYVPHSFQDNPEYICLSNQAKMRKQTEAKALKALCQRLQKQNGAQLKYVCYADYHKFVWGGQQVQAKLNERFNRNINRSTGTGFIPAAVLAQSVEAVIAIGDIFIHLFRTPENPHDASRLIATIITLND